MIKKTRALRGLFTTGALMVALIVTVGLAATKTNLFSEAAVKKILPSRKTINKKVIKPSPSPLKSCESYNSSQTCDAHRDNCAWWACIGKCLPKTITNTAQVCGSAKCTGLKSDACQRNDRCQYGRCSQKCYDKGIPVEDITEEKAACKIQCTRRTSKSDCQSQFECSWYCGKCMYFKDVSTSNQDCGYIY